MTLKLRERKKYILVKSSAKHGYKTLTKQLYLTFCDSFIRRRHLIYCADKSSILDITVNKVDGMDFREVTDWDDFRADVQDYLLENQERLQWGDPSWFDRGWRLWAGEFGGDLATLSWWIPRDCVTNFFIEIPADAELMWQSTTIPKYRGQGLFTYHRLNLLRHRIKEGVEKFFVCCEEFNTTGRKNLPRQGFKYIGCHTRSKITGKKKWDPSS